MGFAQISNLQYDIMCSQFNCFYTQHDLISPPQLLFFPNITIWVPNMTIFPCTALQLDRVALLIANPPLELYH